MANFGGSFGAKGFTSKRRDYEDDSIETDSRASEFDRSNNDLAAALNGRNTTQNK